MPIQILVSSKLSDEDNIWLRNLNRNLPEKDLDWLSRMENRYGSRLDLSAYQYAVLTANQEMLEKIWEDKRMLTAKTCEIIEKSGLGAKWRQQGWQEGIEKGIEEGRLKDARAMFAEDINVETISRVTEIPLKALKKKLSVQ